MLKKINSNSKIVLRNKNFISKTYSNKYKKKIFHFKINSVKDSISKYLNDF